MRPETTEAAWSLKNAVAASFQLDRCDQAYDAAFDDHAARARLAWDDDRRVEAADLFAKLAKNPPLYAAKLGASRHGADLLIDHWGRLDDALDAEGSWTDAESSIALDLLGIPAALRRGRSPLDPPPGVDPTPHRRALIRAEVARLRRRQAEALDALDDMSRGQAEAGATTLLAKPAQLIRRYERDAYRRLYAGMRAARARRPDEAPGPTARPRAVAPSRPPAIEPSLFRAIRDVVAISATPAPPDEAQPGPTTPSPRPSADPGAGRTLNRRQRRALEARSRRA